MYHPNRVASLRRGWYRPIEGIVRLPNGYRLHTDTSSFMEWLVFFKGSYELPIARLIAENLKPGQTAIDVGANVGIHTLTMSRAVGSGTVVACEPHPTIRARLLANLELNAITNVRIEPCAVSSEPGEALLYIPRKDVPNQMIASLVEGSDPTLDAQPLKVQVRTVDELLEGVAGQVGLVKIDVEGVEGAVLRGARRMLERDRPALIFEYTRDKWASSGFSLSGLLQDLRALGYQRFQEIDSGLKPLNLPVGEYANILASA